MKLKTLINILTVLSILYPTESYAGCDFSKGITAGPNKTFIYTEACHLAVGALVQDNQVKTQQIADYVKAISMKDLALTASDTRANLWMSTSSSLEDRLQKVDKLQKDNEWIFFGLGVLTTGFAAYTASKLR